MIRGLMLGTMAILGLLASTEFGAAEKVQSKFKYDGGCQIRCIDGKCEFFCSTGLIYDDTVEGAKVKAKADLKAKASASGTVIEGTVNVTVELDLDASSVPPTLVPENSGANSSETAFAKYSWTVWAHSLRDGDYGSHEYTIDAPSLQVALGQLSLHQLAWGQQLSREGKHYNSIESRPN